MGAAGFALISSSGDEFGYAVDLMLRYDLIVIGSGAGGQRAAIAASKLGKKVCVIERRECVGGVMINTGTIPSKALREAILRIGGHQSAMPTTADFSEAKSRTFAELLLSCHAVIRNEVGIIAKHFGKNRIDLVHGEAKFTGATTLEVLGSEGTRQLQADRFVIAVGTEPTRPASVPFDGHTVMTSDELLTLPELPRSMIVVGGGVIGTEYASMLAALGVKVTLVEGRARLLEFVDAEIAEALQYHLRQAGVTLRMAEKVGKIELVDCHTPVRAGMPTCSVEATMESGKVLKADALLYTIGRQGCTERLGLDAAGLKADERGRIKVDANFQTAVPGIYAVGDVIGFPALASTSMEQGRIAARHAFGEKTETVDELLPYGIYAIPEISMVGWTEERLTAAEIPYEAGVAQYREIARGQLLGDETGMLKMLIHQETHAVLGVHIIGTGATELVHIGQAVIAFKGTAEYFVNTVFNYPTLAECYKVAAMNGLNKLNNV